MDFTTTLDKEKKRIVVKSKCVIDNQCVHLIRAEIKSYLKSNNGWDVLVDHSESTLDPLHYSDMTFVSAETASQFAPFNIRRFALVVNEADYGVGRMWEILIRDKTSTSARVFKTVEEAIRFLDGPD